MHYPNESFVEFECNDLPFQALLAYELNAQKYDNPYGMPVFVPIGERISDYARTYGVTVNSMKSEWNRVEFYINTNKNK
jgi:hypothetical protein